MSTRSDFLTSLRLRRRTAAETAGLPALILAARAAARTVNAGGHARRRAGAGEQFWQFRDYQPGDRIQDIDWRQSAKGDRLHIRQKEWQTAQTALFWCAGGAGMDWRSDDRLPVKREVALTLALGVATLLVEAGEQVGPLDACRRPARHDTALDPLAESLLAASGALLPPTTPPRQAQIVLVGDFLTRIEEIAASFAPLAGAVAGGLVLQTLDPAEIELPYEGRVTFAPTEGMDRYPVNQAAALRGDYRARIDAHCAALAALCHQHGWHYQLHRTDRALRETLATLWAALSPMAVAGAGAA